jgi:putative ABC transport system ATP-binding protein
MPLQILDPPAPVAPPPSATASSPPIIQLENLSKSYREAGQTRLILDSLDLQFAAGEFVCLVGKSGSGKSTLLNLISGIDAPSAGHVTIDTGAIDIGVTDMSSGPVRLTALSEHDRTLFRRQHIGIVFQFFNLIPTLTVLENVTLPLELAGGRGDGRQEAAALLERVGLRDRFDTYPDRLSGGEQQRVAIARALVHNPLLILADEPTGNLDEETGEGVLRLLLELTRDMGKTLIMATHALDVAEQADRVLHLIHGKLVGETAWRAQHAERNSDE